MRQLTEWYRFENEAVTWGLIGQVIGWFLLADKTTFKIRFYHFKCKLYWNKYPMKALNKKKICRQILVQFYLRLKIPKITAQVVLKIDRLFWKISKQRKQVWFKKQNYNKNELLTHTFEHLNHKKIKRICLI